MDHALLQSRWPPGGRSRRLVVGKDDRIAPSSSMAMYRPSSPPSEELTACRGGQKSAVVHPQPVLAVFGRNKNNFPLGQHKHCRFAEKIDGDENDPINFADAFYLNRRLGFPVSLEGDLEPEGSRIERSLFSYQIFMTARRSRRRMPAEIGRAHMLVVDEILAERLAERCGPIPTHRHGRRA